MDASKAGRVIAEQLEAIEQDYGHSDEHEIGVGHNDRRDDRADAGPNCGSATTSRTSPTGSSASCASPRSTRSPRSAPARAEREPAVRGLSAANVGLLRGAPARAGGALKKNTSVPNHFGTECLLRTAASERRALAAGPDRAPRLGIAGVVILGMIMSILDTTIVNVALRHARARPAQLDRADPVGRDRLPAGAGGGDPGDGLGGAALRRQARLPRLAGAVHARLGRCALSTTLDRELVVFRVLQGTAAA